jgi:pre-mRNA-splicing helicase BRR2
MAENLARDQQYQYRATASLVLEQDRSGAPDRNKEPSGEPVSLWGIYDPRKMGDRAERAHPTDELDRFNKKAQKKADLERSSSTTKAQKTKNKISAKERITTGFGVNSVLDAVDDFEGLTYRPRTRETKDAYTLILHFCSIELGDQVGFSTTTIIIIIIMIVYIIIIIMIVYIIIIRY